MQFLALLGMVYFLFGACVCLLICVNPNDPGILGRTRVFFFNTFPAYFSSIVRRVFGERVLGWLGRIKHYLTQTNHPLIQWFYYLIAVGGFIAYAILGIHKHMPSEHVSQPLAVLAYVQAMVCFWVYYKACSVCPGKVTKENQRFYEKKYDGYYDGILFKRNNKCKTCGTIKPARSKHCSITDFCVLKYDHYCVWIRQCVGQKNYKYFLSFLFLHSIWCSYLSVIGSFALYDRLVAMKFWETTFRIGGSLIKGSNLLALQFVFVTETMFFFLIVMCAIMGITLFIFVCYHFFLVAVDQTTNERVKKNDYIDYLKKQIKQMNKFQAKFGDQMPKQFQYQKEKVSKKEYFEIKEDMMERVAILEQKRPNKGFIANMKAIFMEKDAPETG